MYSQWGSHRSHPRCVVPSTCTHTDCTKGGGITNLTPKHCCPYADSGHICCQSLSGPAPELLNRSIGYNSHAMDPIVSSLKRASHRLMPRHSLFHQLTSWLDLIHSGTRNVPSTLILIFALIARCQAANGDDSVGLKCPIFEGVNIAFVSWLIAFSAWVAWKKPELAPFIRGTSQQPTPADPNNPTPRERTALRKWNELNIQLYGAVVSHVSSAIQASLHVTTPDDGVAAINHLKSRYGAQSTGDRAEAMARVQKSYIDPRAKICEADIVKQFNEMSMAVADVQASGGAALDDTLLISMFENALPISYSSIRQMVRYRQHTVFTTYFNDILTQVKAEERSAQSTVATAFTANTGYGNYYQKGRGGKGKGEKGRYAGAYGKGRGKGYGKPSGSYSACFNCGRTDHPRYNCPEPQTVCDYCGANHLSELCSHGPGGQLRDSLSVNARMAIDRATGKGRPQRQALITMTTGDMSESRTQSSISPQPQHPRGFNSYGKRPYSEVTPQDSVSNVGSATIDVAGPSNANTRTSGGERTYIATANQYTPTAREISDFIKSSGYNVFVARDVPANVCMQASDSLHSVVYIDSQASHFVVPDAAYLSKVTDWSPTVKVETANGYASPGAIGELILSIFDDNGSWHTYTVPNVWVLASCKRILYSQPAMNRLGITHRLDEGYILFADGSKKTISTDYSMEVMLGHPSQMCSSKPQPLGVALATRSTIPQRLLWQRLGCPGQRIWLGVSDVISDHGLPPNPHLRYDFDTTDAVTRARSRLLPFHRLRDPDPTYAPGATIYMDFAGPMVPSYPHNFIYYCGAVDAGSGYSRLVPCHSATKEVAKSCLELLVADLRMLMELHESFKPNVVVTDQGTQFMSHFFCDFLAEQQIVHRPAVTYTPQQNSFVERMWGTRFGVARTLLKAANLGPAFHPFAVQTANWVCNRIPQPFKSNLSSFYILSKRLASIAYLKVFGSLARITIPWARREGDKHFADRGLLGIYLGPSEASPGCVVYVPSTRRFYTSRDVICYEDTQPGVKHVDSAWKELQDDIPGSSQHAQNTPSENRPLPSSGADTFGHIDTLVPQPPSIAESPGFDLPPPSTDVDREEYVSRSEGEISAEPDTSVSPISPNPQVEAVPSQSPSQYKRRLPAHDSGDVNDPSSRLFVRRLPNRSSRYAGAYYTDPTSASISQHLQNAIYQALHSHGIPVVGEVMLYESTVHADGFALAITSTVELGDVIIPRSYRQALESPQSSYWRDAISKELKGLMEIGTFDFVKVVDVPNHANIMRCHFVFTVKRHADGSIEKFKARLVADGNTQQWGVDFDRVFSTVAKLSTLRLILAMAAAHDFNLSSVDIRQAYLQAVLSEELYMLVPPGLPDVDETGHKLAVKLKRSLYGLKQAGREWHLLFASTLRQFGFTPSCIDTCLFTYCRGTSLLWIVVWVDDCIIIDNDPSLREEFVRYLSAIHPTEDKGELTWVLQVKVARNRSNRTLTLSQEMYVNDLVKRHGQLIVGLSRKFDSPFEANLELSHDQCPIPNSPEQTEMEPYRETYMSLVGAYLWLSNVSRPDLCFISSQLARYVSNPGYTHYRAALRVLIYLQGSSTRSLTFQPNVNLPLRAFVDANWATKFSISGGVIDYMGCPVHWLSRSQRSVSMSSTESEFFAASLIVKEVMFFRELLSDLNYAQVGPTIIRSDNRGVIDLSFDPTAFKKTKHILRAAHFVRDLSARQVISLQWISGSCNPADLFTKSFTCMDFRRLCALISNLPGIT